MAHSLFIEGSHTTKNTASEFSNTNLDFNLDLTAIRDSMISIALDKGLQGIEKSLNYAAKFW